MPDRQFNDPGGNPAYKNDFECYPALCTYVLRIILIRAIAALRTVRNRCAPAALARARLHLPEEADPMPKTLLLMLVLLSMVLAGPALAERGGAGSAPAAAAPASPAATP
jgi:hypothetical protein